MRRFGRSACALALAVVILSLGASVAFAYDESTSTVPAFTEENCGRCHNPFGYSSTHSPGTVGVHGGYTATTSRCDGCHAVHDAPAAGRLLLPDATSKRRGRVLPRRNGWPRRVRGDRIPWADVASGHSVETTDVVPGGSASTALGNEGSERPEPPAHGVRLPLASRTRSGGRVPWRPVPLIPSVGPHPSADIKTRMHKKRPGGTTTRPCRVRFGLLPRMPQGRSSP